MFIYSFYVPKSNSFISSFISISFILQIISFTFTMFGYIRTASYFNLIVSFIFQPIPSLETGTVFR